MSFTESWGQSKLETEADTLCDLASCLSSVARKLQSNVAVSSYYLKSLSQRWLQPVYRMSSFTCYHVKQREIIDLE